MTMGPAARIPEDRVAEILTRAAELDRDRRETITVDAIRAAALDAGISPSAVDAALEEYTQRQLATVAAAEPESGQQTESRFARFRGFVGGTTRRVARALERPLKLAGALFIVGLAGAAGEGAVILGWAVWILLAGRLVLRHRPDRRAARFILALIGMTVGIGLGFAAGEVDEDVIGGIFALGAAVLPLGSLIIKIRLPARSRRAHGELEAPAA